MSPLYRYFQAAQRELEEQKSASKRAAEETTLLLKDTARKHTKLETSIGGRFPPSISYLAS
jgi:hypothetical protein